MNKTLKFAFAILLIFSSLSNAAAQNTKRGGSLGVMNAHVNPAAFFRFTVNVDEQNNITYNNFILSGRKEHQGRGISIEKIQAFTDSKPTFQYRIVYKEPWHIPLVTYLRIDDEIFTLIASRANPSHVRFIGKQIDLKSTEQVLYFDLTSEMVTKAQNATFVSLSPAKPQNAYFPYVITIKENEVYTLSASELKKFTDFFNSPIQRGGAYKKWEARNNKK